MPFATQQEAIEFIFRSRRKLDGEPRGLDEDTRDISPTRRLLLATGLPTKAREYAIVTGSKGKGSVTAITARLLQSLGHTVGMLTSPHLVSWYERIRINGRAIPEADFLRILSDLAPHIEAEEAILNEKQYISPQGIFLLVALAWFDENDVNAAVLEVGRGGRYDDVTLVNNRVSLITPIVMEHAQYLGRSLERIAWHKAGIIKPQSYVYSLPQAPEVLEMLHHEADAKEAEFFWFAAMDLGKYLEDTPDGLRFRLGRYGDCEIPLLGRYEIDNATLAVQAAGNIHGRLKGIGHGSPEYVERIRAGLASVRWPGRLHKLEDNPQIFVDGAVNVLSLQSTLQSLSTRWTEPRVAIAGVPVDRDYPAVYRLLAQHFQHLTLTATTIHPNIHFPDPEQALAAAREFIPMAQYAPTLPEALEIARAQAGSTGTILMAVAQPLVGESMLIWNVPMEQI